MTEYQNIAIGLLGLTHPEIYFSSRNQPGGPAQSASSTLTRARTAGTLAGSGSRILKRQPILEVAAFSATGASALVRAI